MLKIHVLNVGLGDSLILETEITGEKYFSIIDCKKVAGTIPTVEFLKKNQIKNIQSIFLTHLHKDHYSGFPGLIDYLKEVGGTVEYFISPQLDGQVDIWKKMLELCTIEEDRKSLTSFLESLNFLLHYMPSLSHADELTWGQNLLYEKDPASIAWKPQFHPGLLFAPVNPSPKQVNDFLTKAVASRKSTNTEINNISHALLLKFIINEEEHYAFFTGDLEGSFWRQVKNLCDRLTENKISSNITFLKIPHHGSYKHTTYDIFAKLIDSDRRFLASISCPAHTPVHPGKRTLINLKSNFQNVIIACTNISSHCVKNNGAGEEDFNFDDELKDPRVSEFKEFNSASSKNPSYNNISSPDVCSGDHYCMIDDSNMQVIKLSKNECTFTI